MTPPALKSMSKRLLVLLLPFLLAMFAGCAQGGPAASAGAGSGSVTMYGTVDQGVSFTNH